jgi:GntR family transcriptional regulator
MTEAIDRLTYDSFMPLYFQLKEIFLDKIESKELREGDMIPSENELQKTYGVSRATVRKAIELLVHEGFMEKRKGKGTFVRRRKIEETLPILKSFTEEMAGRHSSKKVISVRYMRPTPEVRARLDVSSRDEVFSLKRLMIVEDKPLGVLHSYVPGTYKLSLDEDYSKSLYRILEKRGIRLGEADQIIEASMSTKEETRLMGLKSPFPTLVIKRVAYSVNGEIVEYVKGVYHGDRYRYNCKLTRY